jgi:hypothetical protein
MAAKKSPKSAPKKKLAKTSLNKSAFIRANPTLSTGELIEKAKKQGLELSTAYVYTLRSSDKAKGGKTAPTKAKASSGGAGVPSKARPQGSPALEAALIDSVLEIGAGPTRAILEGVVAHLKAQAHRK